jgi:hypothetical protein
MSSTSEAYLAEGKIEPMNSIVKKLAALGLLALTMGGAFGCAYGGVASTSDGTVYITRNDLFLLGLLRKVYACKSTGTGLVCSEVQAP